jgi:hypothetical protein
MDKLNWQVGDDYTTETGKIVTIRACSDNLVIEYSNLMFTYDLMGNPVNALGANLLGRIMKRITGSTK